MRPESGLKRPFASFSSTLLPTPAGPSRIRVSPRFTSKEMCSRTSLPSKPMETSSNLTAGASGYVLLSRTSLWRADPAMVNFAAGSSPEDANHEFADDKVDGDDEYRRDNHSLRSGFADPLGSAAGIHAVIAPNGGNDKSEEDRLCQSLDYVRELKSLIGGVEVLRSVIAQQEDGDGAAAQRADCVGDNGEEEHHHDRGDDARHYQLLQRVRAERAHGVNLLGHHHRTQFAGHS